MTSKKPYYKRHNLKGKVVYLSQETFADLKAMAYDEDRSVQKLLQRIIKEALLLWKNSKR